MIAQTLSFCWGFLFAPKVVFSLVSGKLLHKIFPKKGVNTLPKVVLRNNESPEQMLRRFNKEVIKSKVLADVRRKRWFVSKSELRRIEKKKASRRARRVQRQGE